MKDRLRVLVQLCILIGTPPAVAQTVVSPNLRVELVDSGLSRPTSMAFVGDDDILVLQKDDGRVRRILGGSLLVDDVLDVNVHFRSERGLLGITNDPDFVNNGYVYLFYTESSTAGDTSSSSSTPLGNRVYRYTWNGSALVDPLLVLDLPVTPGPNHDGGIIDFGPDDALYAVIGDLNRNGKLENFPLGADPDDTAVIFRVHPLGGPLTDNPFYDPNDASNPLGRYYAYGIRNSFGMGFDPVSGELWDSENGPSNFDEVNLVVRGFNSGWEQIMGPGNPQGLWVAPGSVYRDPEFSWTSTVAPTAVGFVASRLLGCEVEHDLLVGDNNCGQLYRFRPNPARDGLEFSTPSLQDKVTDNVGQACSGAMNELDEIIFGGSWGAITDIENGPDGRVYVVSLSRGAVYRIAPDPGTFPDADADGVDDACDCAQDDATAYAVPTEIPRLRLGGEMPTSLGWNAQGGTAGPGTSYTVVTGSLQDLRSDGGFDAACTLGSVSPQPALDDSLPDPTAGTGRYYLVRAGNSCDAGTYGNASALPDPRDLLDAADPIACSTE